MAPPGACLPESANSRARDWSVPTSRPATPASLTSPTASPRRCRRERAGRRLGHNSSRRLLESGTIECTRPRALRWHVPACYRTSPLCVSPRSRPRLRGSLPTSWVRFLSSGQFAFLGGNTIRTRHRCAGPCWCIRQVDVPVGSRPAPGPPAELVPSRWRLVPRHRGDVPTADLASSCAGPCLPQPSLGLAPKLWPRPLLASLLHALDRCFIKSARHPASAP